MQFETFPINPGTDTNKRFDIETKCDKMHL